ncbi:DUF6681 family protein [Paucilactobacillus suebicus]|uniref:Uncharacterized protein n=1 Tax=Paucilactobacillus suebicus DSM 5007 = KCTC 3549 TaxID=1423807 RepID=A0A0R1WAZ0_9LACO|nr:DUF6681 family protein [Paucilactobacillus suebicus]KRM13044.1 hypothetical protein FD16_GL001734 [Paucilactobacillus suebicus DSM 5007 = KCTC 3549]
MLSLLDMINHSLGYFNLNVKLKNRLYTVIGFVGQWYLLYVAIRLLQNGKLLRGSLYTIVFILIFYFSVLNIIYYFTNKRSKFDISPKIEKLMGGPRKEDLQQENNVQNTAPVIPANGLFTDDQILPADVVTNEHEKANLKRVVKQMIEAEVLLNDYNGMSESEIISQNRETGEAIPALRPEQPIPYFELVPTGARLEIYVGINQMERLAVGHITSVGLTEVSTARKNYKLYLANVFISGGPVKIAGRSDSTIVSEEPYDLNVKVAYKTKTTD